MRVFENRGLQDTRKNGDRSQRIRGTGSFGNATLQCGILKRPGWSLACLGHGNFLKTMCAYLFPAGNIIQPPSQ